MLLQLLLVPLIASIVTCVSDETHKPRIRGITAFLRMELANLHSRILEGVSFLRRANDLFQNGGYDVQTLRITTQPLVEYRQQISLRDLGSVLRTMDDLADQYKLTISVGPAMQSDDDDPRIVDLLTEILAGSRHLAGSVRVADDSGVHLNAIEAAAKAIMYLSQNSSKGQGNFSFAAIAMLPPYCPFFPGSYFDGTGNHFSVALESANVVLNSLRSSTSHELQRVALQKTLAEALTAVEKVANRVTDLTEWSFAGIDASPAPGEQASIGSAIERLSGAPFGSSGTLSAVALITNVVRNIPVDRVGYSGLMMPITEDHTLAKRWAEGRISIDALLAYSSVSGTGLDTIPLPGDISEIQVRSLVRDVATLAITLRKPLSVRLLPVPGKRAGESTEFDDPRLVNTVLQDLP